MSTLEFVPPRMLVVDDVEDNRLLLARSFEKRGYDVTHAESGALALQLIDREAFDVVMLDIMMPGMCGIDTLRSIRRRFSAGKLPVIMTTAKAAEQDIVEALEYGANDYLTKPINMAIAFARVTSQLERKRAEDALQRSVVQMSVTAKRLELEIQRYRKAQELAEGVVCPDDQEIRAGNLTEIH